MTLIDTDVAVDVLRGHPPAISWLQGLGTQPIGLPGLVVMELIQGCRTRAEQTRVEQFCQPYVIYWPTKPDCQRARRDFARFYLSHNLGLLDALIAATAIGLGQPLATFNVKHYGVITGLRHVQPY